MPLKSFFKSAIETGKRMQAEDNRRKKTSKKKTASKAKNRTKSQFKGGAGRGILGKARSRRDSALNRVMGEMKKTRGR